MTGWIAFWTFCRLPLASSDSYFTKNRPAREGLFRERCATFDTTGPLRTLDPPPWRFKKMDWAGGRQKLPPAQRRPHTRESFGTGPKAFDLEHSRAGINRRCKF